MKTNLNQNPVEFPINEELSCGECGSVRIRTKRQEITFPYGNGQAAVELKAIVPIRQCENCGRQFLDWEAEDAEHEAVCRHLDVLTPAEIMALRKSLGLSREEFAKLTELGDATIARWERAEIIQNKAHDRYLRLLRDNPRNIDLLKRLRKKGEKNGSPPKASPAVKPIIEIKGSGPGQANGRKFQSRVLPANRIDKYYADPHRALQYVGVN